MFKKKKIIALYMMTLLIAFGQFSASVLNAEDNASPETVVKNIAPQAGGDPTISRDFKYHQAKERFAAPEQNPEPELVSGMPNFDGTMAVDNFNEYILGPEDRIKITVFGEEELSSDYRVGSDGTIAFPLIGDVKVEGLTLRQTEEAIRERLKQGFLKKPSVSIEVSESRPFYILGEVRRPGSYNYIAGMNVLQAVTISGGFTYRANRKAVEILRGSQAPAEPMTASTGETVKPGDIIFIRERFF